MNKKFLNSFYPLAEGFVMYPKHMAKPTGEFRNPKKGEWYLSGSIIEAYQAKNDMTNQYHIAQLCMIVKKNVQIIEEVK